MVYYLLMSELVVTSLPISVRENPKFRTMITPMNAAFVARSIDADLLLWHGLYGISHPEFDTTELTNTYARFAGQETAAQRDDNPGYQRFMQDRIAELVESGQVACQDRAVMSCACNVVNIDSLAFQSLPINKIRHVSGTHDNPTCAHCQEELVENTADRLVLVSDLNNAPEYQAAVLPAYTRKKTAELFDELSSRTQIISKIVDVGYYPEVTIGNKTFKVDPDFWMLGTPLYSAEQGQQVCVVAGAEQQSRVFNSIAFWSRFRSTSEIRAVLHPRINFTGPATELQAMTAQDFIDKYTNTTMGRLLVAKCLNWSNHNATLGPDTLSIAYRTATNAGDTPSPDQAYGSVESLVSTTGPNVIDAVFKATRRRSYENPGHSRLAYAILGIEE